MAMSGGVDSSVAAALLKGEDEFDVVDQFWRRFFGRYSIKKAA